PNWRFSVLPYLDQSALYNQLSAVEPQLASGFSSMQNPTDARFSYGTGNFAILAGLSLPVFRCPSSVWDPNFYEEKTAKPFNFQRGQTHHYAGIAGGFSGPP